MSNDLVKRLHSFDCITMDGCGRKLRHEAADRIEQLAATNEELEAKLEAVTTVRELMGHMWGDAEDKLEKAIGALEKVQAFVRDLEPHADQGHTLVPALREACETLVELKQGA
jgi:hypothetical protein